MIRLSYSRAFAFVCFFCFSTFLLGQCPDQNNTTVLSGQAEVDAFLAANPDCTFIDELEFEGEITDLSGFSNLKSMNYLYFSGCMVSSLTGFENLDTIHGNLGFYNEAGFSDLCGLNNLKYIGQDLRLEETVGLKTLKGLESLTFIEDDITIFGNSDLENLNGLQNLTAIGSDPSESHNIQITDNPKLTNCCGAQSIVSLQDLIWELSNNASSACNSINDLINIECVTIDDTCLSSVEKFEIKNGVILFPNPATSYLDISYNDFPVLEIAVFDLFGQQISVDMESENRVSLSNVSEGLYIISFTANGKRFSQKFLKLR